MMTMRDMFEQGIEIQGNIKVNTYHHDTDEIETLFYGDADEIDHTVEDSFLDMEVTFMFAYDEDFGGGMLSSGICFEVGCKME